MESDFPDPRTVTGLLHRWNGGDESARDELVPLVYDTLRRLAARYAAGEKKAITLQPTALVHEVYMRMAGNAMPDWRNRGQFFGIAARLMRQVLVDEARARNRNKRGGGAVRVELQEGLHVESGAGADVLRLHEALEEMARFDERRAKIVELRYFGGFTEEETADALEVSVSTVRRDTRLAEAWLRSQLAAKGAGA